MSRQQMAGVAIAALLALRAVMAAILPLSADEAYYWLWSRHLAAGYFDHPPAIAFLIRAGTLLFGDTAFGVRASSIPLSLLASWFVWQSARLVLKDDGRAVLAALFFNLTLMAGVEMLAATPDLPSITTVAAYLWCLCKLQETQNGRWWLAAGAAAGLSLLSKYSMLFAGLGTLVWLLAGPRRWLSSPWPYLGGAIALIVFAPNLLWQASHHWMTFAFQFGRIGQGGLTLRYVGEFFGAQLGLATPLIFILACCGLLRASRRGGDRFLLAALVWTALAYFLFHALRDRVQGNWPSFLYPVLAILAASSFRGTGWWRWPSWAAAPLAAIILFVAYAQAAFGLLPIRHDPFARLLGKGFPKVAEVIATASHAGLAEAVLTTDYETTAWMRFYRPDLKVVQVNEPWRYPDAPAPDAALLHGRLIYLVEGRREQADVIQKYFARVSIPTVMSPEPAGSPVYELFLLADPKSSSFGKMP